MNLKEALENLELLGLFDGSDIIKTLNSESLILYSKWSHAIKLNINIQCGYHIFMLKWICST